MRVLLTGATGFLGRHTVNRLLKENIEIIALGRNPLALERLRQIGCSVHAIDLYKDSLFTVLEGVEFDKILHAAALSSPWGTYEDFHKANVIATEKLLALAANRNTAVVYVSTPSVYLGNGITANIPETAPLSTQPMNHYCSTKIAAEQHLVAWQKETGVSTIILRPQGLLGAHDPSFAPRICAQLKKGFFPLINGGQAQIDMTHVENVAEALWLSVKSNHSGLQTYNITNGEPRAVRDTIALFAKKMEINVRYLSVPATLLFSAARGLELLSHITGGWEPPITVYGMTVMGIERTLSITAARKELGYEPKKSIAQAVDEYFER